MNYVQIVGKYVEKPRQLEKKNYRSFAAIGVSVRSNFMNQSGNYDFITFQVVLWKGMSKEFITSVPLDTLIAVKGRLEKWEDEIVIIAEQIEYLDCY